MAFAGYLIKLGGSGGTELPLDYIRVESYTAVTNLTENASMKSVTGRKYRQTAEHKAVQVSFQSKAMDNTSLAALNAMILAAMSDQSSRDITLEYYDRVLKEVRRCLLFRRDTGTPWRRETGSM